MVCAFQMEETELNMLLYELAETITENLNIEKYKLYD